MAITMCRSATCLALIAVGSVVLAACGTHAGHSASVGPATGVVTGRVTAGPTCPVERVGHACLPMPVVADVQARAAGRVVASGRSRADGTYRLDLPGGTYTVVAVTPNLLPRCPARTVTVTAARTISGDIACDTGIR
jgi:hypothetical protein